MVNESLSDRDFRDVRRMIDEDAKATWQLGKMLGCQADCNDEVVIDRIKVLQARC